MIIIKIPIQYIRQYDGWACFTLHNPSILGAICDKQTRRSDSTFSPDLYLVFILLSAENAFSHIGGVLQKEKVNNCIAAAIVSIALQFIVRLELLSIISLLTTLPPRAAYAALGCFGTATKRGISRASLLWQGVISRKILLPLQRKA